MLMTAVAVLNIWYVLSSPIFCERLWKHFPKLFSVLDRYLLARQMLSGSVYLEVLQEVTQLLQHWRSGMFSKLERPYTE